MKHKTSFIIVYWWLLALLLCGLGLMAFAEKEERISESENRILSGFPELSLESLTSGEFFLGIESYLSDGVWGRDQIVGVSESLLGFFSASSAEEEALLSDAAMADEITGETLPADSPEAPENTPATPGQETAPTEAAEDSAPSDAPEGYGMWRIHADGTYDQIVKARDSDLQTVAGVLNGFKSHLPEDGMVFYANVPMTNTAHTARDSWAGWYDNLDDGLAQYTDEGVYMINVPGLLEGPLWAGEPVYFDSDHHWTPRGAILAVNECIRIQGRPVVPYEEYDYTVNQFGNATKHTLDDMELMHPLLPVAGNSLAGGRVGEEKPLMVYTYRNYRAYLDGDSSVWTRYVTGFATGRSALVVGDSFSNAFTPYLTPYYDTIYKVDARYYEPRENGGTIAELMEKYGVDDVYIVLSQANGVVSDTSQRKLERALNG